MAIEREAAHWTRGIRSSGGVISPKSSCFVSGGTCGARSAINPLRKGQVQGTCKGDSVSQVRFINRAFGLAT
jgi:hypothetical protein